MAKVVIVGAGVSGLTVALLLSQNARNSITVAAKHMPGDSDIEYASPVAGANFMPFAEEGSPSAEFERRTWYELERLAKARPDAGIHFQECILYKRDKDDETPTGKWVQHLMDPNAWYKDMVPGFSTLDAAGLPAGVDRGQRFTSICINPPIYLAWLVSRCLKSGVIFRRANLKHVEAAVDLHHSGTKADAVVNCTGIGSILLGGVSDQTVYPARGQLVIVRNDPGNSMLDISGVDDGPAEACYIMKRAAGGGTVLGGSYQEHCADEHIDLELAKRIMKRAVNLCPSLTGGKGMEALDVIRHAVGLRPLRKDGVRVESEWLGDTLIVHNYGHGGAGYQMSYGTASKAVSLIQEGLIDANGKS